ncbi:MAG: tetratricopeptide repeat protein [Pseudomonadota bacterium]
MRGFKLVSIVFLLGAFLNGCANRDVVLSNRGFEEISKGNYAEAEKHLEEALLLSANNPYALLNMGVVYHKTGRLEKARKMYERVIALQPGEQAALSNMESLEGKQLVDIAKRNLELLQSQETASTVVSEKPLPYSAPQVTKPVGEEAPGRFPEMRDQEEKAETFVQPREASEVIIEDGQCRVHEGDTLLKIAGRDDVYGDALKWPAIYHLNMDVLGGMTVSKSFLNAKLREGLRLKYVTAQGASHHLNAIGNKLWVVDVASARSLDELVESAVLLMKNGYHVYLTKHPLAGEEWIRLRIGFFEGLSEALAAGQEVRSLLGLPKAPWIVKVSREELQTYGGY